MDTAHLSVRTFNPSVEKTQRTQAGTVMFTDIVGYSLRCRRMKRLPIVCGSAAIEVFQRLHERFGDKSCNILGQTLSVFSSTTAAERGCLTTSFLKRNLRFPFVSAFTIAIPLVKKKLMAMSECGFPHRILMCSGRRLHFGESLRRYQESPPA